MADALTDPLERWDPKSQELAYNNYTDRMKVELPSAGDPASSGCITLIAQHPADQDLIQKRFSYNDAGDISTIKEALVITPSGSPCKLSTFIYDTSDNIDYIVESLGTW